MSMWLKQLREIINKKPQQLAVYLERNPQLIEVIEKGFIRYDKLAEKTKIYPIDLYTLKKKWSTVFQAVRRVKQFGPTQWTVTFNELFQKPTKEASRYLIENQNAMKKIEAGIIRLEKNVKFEKGQKDIEYYSLYSSDIRRNWEQLKKQVEIQLRNVLSISEHKLQDKAVQQLQKYRHEMRQKHSQLNQELKFMKLRKRQINSKISNAILSNNFHTSTVTSTTSTSTSTTNNVLSLNNNNVLVGSIPTNDLEGESHNDDTMIPTIVPQALPDKKQKQHHIFGKQSEDEEGDESSEEEEEEIWSGEGSESDEEDEEQFIRQKAKQKLAEEESDQSEEEEEEDIIEEVNNAPKKQSIRLKVDWGVTEDQPVLLDCDENHKNIETLMEELKLSEDTRKDSIGLPLKKPAENENKFAVRFRAKATQGYGLPVIPEGQFGFAFNDQDSKDKDQAKDKDQIIKDAQNNEKKALNITDKKGDNDNNIRKAQTKEKEIRKKIISVAKQRAEKIKGGSRNTRTIEPGQFKEQKNQQKQADVSVGGNAAEQGQPEHQQEEEAFKVYKSKFGDVQLDKNELYY